MPTASLSQILIAVKQPYMAASHIEQQFNSKYNHAGLDLADALATQQQHMNLKERKDMLESIFYTSLQSFFIF